MEVSKNNKEWELIEKLSLGAQKEITAARRWKNIFRAITLVYVGIVLYAVYLSPTGQSIINNASAGSHAGYVDLNGEIVDGGAADAGKVIEGLRNAFSSPGTKAVILGINTPGGSVVQSGYIHDEILRLRDEYPDKPIYSVIKDIGASGGYYVAVATNGIFAHESSLVGSIGVTAGGFGDAGLLETLGIERRKYVAGKHKAFLDPFAKENPDEKMFWEGVLSSTHTQFIEKVKNGREGKLQASDDELFNGLIWNGDQALTLGLIDGLHSVDSISKKLINVEKVVDYSVPRTPYDGLLGKLGATFGKELSRSVSATFTGNGAYGIQAHVSGM